MANRHGIVKAIFNGKVIAKSENTKKVEGNYYFPPGSFESQYFQQSNSHTLCPWKGVASYYDLEVEGEKAQDIAWTYKLPFLFAWHIRKHVSFYDSVEIEIEKP